MSWKDLRQFLLAGTLAALLIIVPIILFNNFQADDLKRDNKANLNRLERNLTEKLDRLLKDASGDRGPKPAQRETPTEGSQSRSEPPGDHRTPVRPQPPTKPSPKPEPKPEPTPPLVCVLGNCIDPGGTLEATIP